MQQDEQLFFHFSSSLPNQHSHWCNFKVPACLAFIYTMYIKCVGASASMSNENHYKYNQHVQYRIHHWRCNQMYWHNLIWDRPWTLSLLFSLTQQVNNWTRASEVLLYPVLAQVLVTDPIPIMVFIPVQFSHSQWCMTVSLSTVSDQRLYSVNTFHCYNVNCDQ